METKIINLPDDRPGFGLTLKTPDAKFPPTL